MKTDTVVTMRQPGEFADPLTEMLLAMAHV